MSRFESTFVVTHLAFRDGSAEPTEGPFSSLSEALSTQTDKVSILGLPLNGYKNCIVYGNWQNTKKIKLPDILGYFFVTKFVLDVLITTTAVAWWSITNTNKRKLVIGIDPLSCLPLWVLKKFFGYKLIFHCVDFNRNRFKNSYLQKSYELADKLASKYSDQTWVICQSLKDYKKKVYGITSYYVPNSVKFDEKISKIGISSRKGNKMIWTGSLLTERQFDIFFSVLLDIQGVFPKIKFVVAPTKEYEKFIDYNNKYKLNNFELLKLNSRLEFQKIASKCDIGIALYDELFGSTEFIEPMKIWDFLLCGLPFIVSSEPSISKPIIERGVVCFMRPKNQLPKINILKQFLSKTNLSIKAKECLAVAKEYDIERQLKKRLDVLLLQS